LPERLLALLLVALLEFTSRAGAPIAINPDAVEAVFERPGQHAEIRLLSGAIVEVSESYADTVRRLRGV
jgi:hypothetical protein